MHPLGPRAALRDQSSAYSFFFFFLQWLLRPTIRILPEPFLTHEWIFVRSPPCPKAEPEVATTNAAASRYVQRPTR